MDKNFCEICHQQLSRPDKLKEHFKSKKHINKQAVLNGDKPQISVGLDKYKQRYRIIYWFDGKRHRKDVSASSVVEKINELRQEFLISMSETLKDFLAICE